MAAIVTCHCPSAAVILLYDGVALPRQDKEIWVGGEEGEFFFLPTGTKQWGLGEREREAMGREWGGEAIEAIEVNS